jgi:proteic killer suppression protein
VIKTFRGKDTEKVFDRKPIKRWSKALRRIARRKLLLVDAAGTIDDLKVPPINHLEKLKGDRKGQYSIRINDQWRVCFRFVGGDAYEVEIVDYH